MLTSLLKNLCLSSLLIIALSSCSPTLGYKFKRVEGVTSANIHTIINKDNSLLYKAQIKLYNGYFSGLIILKQIDSVTSHLVFVTELGMKMFDFKIQNGELELVFVFAPLNKPKIIKMLKSDMKLILLQHLLNRNADVFEKPDGQQYIYKIQNEKFKNYYFINSVNKTVDKILVKGNFCKKEKVDYIYDETLISKQIKLRHKGFIRLQIELNNISKNY